MVNVTSSAASVVGLRARCHSPARAAGKIAELWIAGSPPSTVPGSSQAVTVCIVVVIGDAMLAFQLIGSAASPLQAAPLTLRPPMTGRTVGPVWRLRRGWPVRPPDPPGRTL
jgi:hypothetical protein